MAFLISIFLHEVMFVYFGGKFSNESSLIFLAKKLLGETLCKLEQIFPPKVLVYTRKVFSWHLSNDLTETCLIKLNKNSYLITLSETIKITKKTEYFGESIINQIYKRQDKIMNNFYWQLYDYNKRWWNKIQLHKIKKNGACVFLSTVFFRLLAGKFTTTEQMLLTEL